MFIYSLPVSEYFSPSSHRSQSCSTFSSKITHSFHLGREPFILYRFIIVPSKLYPFFQNVFHQLCPCRSRRCCDSLGSWIRSGCWNCWSIVSLPLTREEQDHKAEYTIVKRAGLLSMLTIRPRQHQLAVPRLRWILASSLPLCWHLQILSAIWMQTMALCLQLLLLVILWGYFGARGEVRKAPTTVQRSWYEPAWHSLKIDTRAFSSIT